VCVCVQEWGGVVGGGSVDRERERGMTAGRAGHAELPRESPEPRFIQLLR